jgi:putative copper export protein
VLTGVVSALVLVPLGSFLTTAYGIMVIVKAALVAVVGVMAIAGRAWLGRVPAQPDVSDGPGRATRLECCGLAAVLAAAAVLTVLTPPAAPARGAPARAAHAAGTARRASG